MVKLYIFLISLMLIPTYMMSQKIEVSGSGSNARIFVNCIGLPMYEQCPEHIPLNYFESYYTINSDKAYTFPTRRFEISRYDSGNQTQSWVWAAKKCENLNENGKNWRLPNQKELFLIYVLRPVIEGNAGFPIFNNGFYMSGLVSTKESLFPYPQTQVDLSNGNSKSAGAELGYYIRCVRDILD